jgi:hypothetical protein
VRPGFKSIRAESLILLQLCSKDHETFQARQCLCDLDVYLPLVLVPRRATNYFAEEQNVPALYSDNRAMSQPFTRDQLDASACKVWNMPGIFRSSPLPDTISTVARLDESGVT